MTNPTPALSAEVDDIFLPDGTILEVEDPQTPDTFVPVADPLTIPAIGDTAEFVNVESISDIAPKYKATIGEAEDFAIQMNYVEDSTDGTQDPGQQMLIAAAKARTSANIRITIPGMANTLNLNVTFGAWTFDALEKRSSVKLTVSGRKNGEVTETPIAP